MLVRQLIGRYAGELLFMDPAVAKACLAAGTVTLPEVKRAPKQKPKGTPKRRK